MKYFFILLFMFFSSTPALADKKTPIQPENYSPGGNGPKISINNGNNGEATSIESSMSKLKNTELAEAIIKGDKEKYEKALSDLKTFKVNLLIFMEQADMEGNTLLDLMATTKENREYFSQQMMDILTLFYRAQKSNSKLEPTEYNVILVKKVNGLLKKAHSADNTQAVQMLHPLRDIFQFNNVNFISKEEHRSKMKTAVEQLKKDIPSARSITLQALVSTTGLFLGYRLITDASLPLLEFTNLWLPADLAITPVHIAGVALLGVGGEYTVRAIKSCKKAFQNRKKIKQVL